MAGEGIIVDNYRRVRIALYSHDTMGLGHIRRNINLAWGFQKLKYDIQILLITGSPNAQNFFLPPNSELLVLPAYYKNLDGSYGSSVSRLSLNQLSTVRSLLISDALSKFQPDIFIVDNVARGFNKELDKSLELLKENNCLNILGLRDIRDEAEHVVQEWQRDNYNDFVDKIYNRVWVYGDRNVYDIVEEYQLSWRNQIFYTGYLNTKNRDSNYYSGKILRHKLRNNYVLCMVGGGQDGDKVALSFAQAEIPDGFRAVLLTGPYMCQDTKKRLNKLIGQRPELIVLDFDPEPAALIKNASLVITMGGYNSIVEILTHKKKALVVPRVRPRKEQYIRAERLQELGLVDLIHPEDLSGSRLSHWIYTNKNCYRTIDTSGINLNGITFVKSQLESIIEEKYHVFAEAQA